MANLTHGGKTVTSTASWEASVTQDAKTKTYHFGTAGTYCDQDIDLKITAQDGGCTVGGGGLTAGSGSSSINVNGLWDGTNVSTTDKIAMTTTATNGYYKLGTTGKGTVNRAAITDTHTAGWIPAKSTTNVSDATSLSSNSGTSTYYVKKATNSKTNGTASATANAGTASITKAASASVSITDNIGTTTKPNGTAGTDYWALSASAGSGIATATGGSASASVTASSATVSDGYNPSSVTVSTTASSTGNKTGNTATTTESTASATRYITKSTASKTDATASASVNKNPSASASVTTGGIETTTTNTGYSMTGSASAASGTATASVTASSASVTAGYNPSTVSTSTAAKSATSTEKTASDSKTVYIKAASFANTATSGTTYTDYTSSGPVLKSGDYLYINAGYTPARKISLAKLVPDSASGATDIKAGMLQTISAYDNDGALITGDIATKTDSGNVSLTASTTSKSYAAGYYPNAHGASVASIGFSNITTTTTDQSSNANYIPIVTTAGVSALRWSNALTIPTKKAYSVTATAGADSSNRTRLTYAHNSYTHLDLVGTSTTDVLATIYPGKAFGTIYLGNWTAESRTTRGYLGALTLLGYGTNTSYPDYLETLNIGTSTTNKNSKVNTINNYGTIGTLAQTGTISTVSGDQTITNVSGTLRVGNNAQNGTVTVNAYDNASTPALTGAKTVVSGGKWTQNTVTPSSSAQGPYYGRTSVSAVSLDTAKGITGTTSRTAGDGSSSIDATNTNISVTAASSKPSSGYYLRTKGEGKVSTGTGYITSGTTPSNSGYQYYTVPTATATATKGTASATKGTVSTSTLTSGTYQTSATSGYTYKVEATGGSASATGGSASVTAGYTGGASASGDSASATGDSASIYLVKGTVTPNATSGTATSGTAALTKNTYLTIGKGYYPSDITYKVNNYTEESHGASSTGTSATGTKVSTVTPGTSDKYVNITAGATAAKYWTIAGDADLIASNIKSGVEIFGVTGTYNNEAHSSYTPSSTYFQTSTTGAVSGAKINANQYATSDYYVKSGSVTLSGTASSAKAKATIANTNSMANVSTSKPSSGTAGTNYWEVKATPAQQTAGSVTPTATVGTAGWVSSISNGSAVSVSVSAGDTASLYIGKAAGSVTMTKGNGSVSGSTGVTLETTNNSGLSVSGNGAVSATAKIDTAGYTPTNTSFATGSSTSSNTATKYLKGVTLQASKQFEVNDGTYNWTWKKDASGNSYLEQEKYYGNFKYI